MCHTLRLVDFNKLAAHTGKEDVAVLCFLAYFGEPFDAVYGDLDVDFSKTNEAQGVNVGGGGCACVVVMRGHAFKEFPSKFAYKGLHDTVVLVLWGKSDDGREKSGDDDGPKDKEPQLPRC